MKKIFTFLSWTVVFLFFTALSSYGQNLNIRKSGPTNANPGDLITYTITYSNTGSILANNVVIVDYLPAQVNSSYVSSFPAGNYNSVTNTVTWNSMNLASLKRLDAGSGENTIQVTVRVGKLGTGPTQSPLGYYVNTSPATLSNYATITSNPGSLVTGNTVETLVTYACTFKLSEPSGGIKSATNSTLTYIVSITNTGNIYQKYSLSSALFSGQNLFQFIKTLGDVALSETPFIAPGETYFFHYVLITPNGTSPNQITETKITATPSLCGTVHDALYSTFIYGGQYNNYELLDVYKIDTPDPVQSGSQLTYQVVISNVGSALTNVRLTETYPSNTTLSSASPIATTGNNIWDFPTLPSGNTIINVTLNVANGLPNGTILNNTLKVSNGGTDWDTFTEPTMVVSAPDLTITKTATVVNPPAAPNSTVNYTLTYTNNGNYAASGIVIKDNYDENYMNVGSIGSGTNLSGEITWNIPASLAPGASGTINYSMTIKNDALLFLGGSTNIINNAIISSNLPDSNINDNMASATVNVFVLPDLKIEKTISSPLGGIGLEGQPVTYSLNVSNVGKLDHTGGTYTVIEYLPVGTTYLSHTPIDGIYDSGSGTITWTISDNLPVNGFNNFTVTLAALPCELVGTGTLTNRATVYSNTYGDADVGNNEFTLVSDVADNENPTVTSATDVVTTTSSDATGNCTADVVIADAATSDNCTVSKLTWALTGVTTTSSAATGINQVGTQTFNIGVTTITYTVTDGSGNISTDVLTVTVTDDEPPTVTASANVVSTSSADATGDCQVSLTIANAVFGDNCSSSLSWSMSGATTGNGSGQVGIHVFNTGVTTITYTNTDGSNSATATQTVTVTDTEDPTITAPATVTVASDAGLCSAVIASIGTPVTGDNCAVATVISDHPSTTYPVGNTTVTWTVTDASGNTATATQLVTVTDNINPTITAPATVTVDSDAGLCSAVIASIGIPVTGDNCAVATVISDHPSTTYPVGNTTVTWTVTDIHGNSATAIQTITVTDTEDPTITAPATVAVDSHAGLCSAVIASIGIPVTGDNCAVATVISDHPSTTYPAGSTMVTWTVTDIHGNSATAIQTITVTDTEDPTITAPATVTVDSDAGLCSAVIASIGTPVTGDNCAVATVISDHPSTTYPVGNTTVTWTVTDASGNTATATQLVTVTDNINPTITAPATVTVDSDAGLCSAVIASIGIPVTGDNCAVATVISDHPSTTYPVGSTTVTWTVTDASGNTATATQLVTVTDNINPTITAPVAVTGTTNVDCTSTNVVLGTPVTADNCSVASVTSDAPSAFLVGQTTVTWTVTDASGNTATATQLVTVTDNINPTITAPATVAVASDAGLCSAVIASIGTPVTGDNCLVASVTSDAPSAFLVGHTTVTWTVTDASGNTATATQLVTVTDNVNPTITAPVAATGTTNVDCTSTNVVLGTPVTADNCSVASVTNDAPSAFQIGQTTVTWTVTDASGNAATATQLVTVTDNVNPIITAPVAVTGTTNVDCTSTNVVLGTPVTADNCLVASVTNDAPSAFPIGQTTVTWTVTDASGNAATATQLVTVTDNVNPTIAAPVAATGTTNVDCTSTNVVLGTPVTADNCLVASVTNDAPSAFQIGQTTVTWTVTDASDNAATATQLVTVTDNINPTITAPATVAVASDAGLCSAVIASIGTPVTGDNCAVATVISDHPSTTYPVGNTTVTWTVTDIHGNSATAIQTITVTDTEDPTITAPATVTVDSDAGLCSAVIASIGIPVTGDNCAVATVISDHPSTTYPAGNTTVTWTVTDIHGNSATAIQTITVTDTEDPTITAPATVAVASDAGLCSAVIASIGTPVTADNCAVATVISDHPSTTYPVGNTTVTWTVTDSSGNTDTATQIVRVTDNVSPIITAPVAATGTTNVDCTSTNVVLGTPVTADNCSVASVTNDAPSAFPIGQTTVTWTVTDASGNTATATQLVTVTDNVNPTIAAPVAATGTTNVDCTSTNVVLGTPVTADNCLVASVTNDAPSAFQIGQTTVTWTVTDASGNTATATQLVTVTDNINPTITAPATVAVASDAGLCSAVIASIGTPVTGDNCAVATVISDHPSTTYPVGNTTVTWTVTDIHGNSATAIQTITVTDTEDPTITAPVAATGTTNVDCTSTNVVLGTPVTADNCSVASVTNDAPSAFQIGQTTVTWTVTDASGNAATATQLVTVTDNVNPTITAPVAATGTTNVDCTSTNVVLGTPVTADNCLVASVTNDAPSAFPIGQTTVTWTVTDASGNAATATQLVTVTDNINPIITAPVAATGTTNVDCTSTNVVLGTPVTADNCSVASVTNDAPSAFLIGQTTVTWTVTDASGNTATATQLVTVTDNINPTITAPATVAVASDAGLCSAVIASIGTPVTGDNCAVATVISDHPSTTYLVGNTTVTWTVTDIHGNSATAIQTITVTDTEDPTITAPVAATGTTNVDCTSTNVVLGTPVTADNCSVASVTSDAPSAFLVGQTTVTWTVTDASGNTATATQLVTVTDNVNPTITAPATVAVASDAGLCSAVIASIGTPATGDNCAVATVISDHPSTTYPAGNTTVTWTVTDIHGNSATAIQTITVTDTEDPTITAPATVTVDSDAGLCSAVIASIGTLVTADNCAVATVISDHPSTTYPVGSTTVTWTVTDSSGNTATATQLVTVNDNINPTITAPATLTVASDAGLCSAVITSIGTPVTSDNCAVASVTSDAPSAFLVGHTTVTWTVTDASGNTATATQLVTVTDNVNPTITAPVAATGTTNVDCTSTNVVLGTPVTADNCSVASVTSDAPSAFLVGQTTVTWIVTDSSGNTATATQLVTVTDNVNPIITAPVAATGTTNVDCTSTNVVLGTPVTADNCLVASVTNDAPSAFPIGQTTVTWTVTDASGNAATATQLVTVTDNINPTITAPVAVTGTTNVDCTSTNVTLGTPVTADNCSVASITNNAPASFPLGEITVTWIITDASGNTATATQLVTVTDNINPTITAPMAATGTTNVDCTSSNVVLGTPVTGDNCSVASITNNAPAVFPLGETTVTWIVTDASGNTATATQLVTVTDNINPTITAPMAATGTTNVDCTSSNVVLGTPVTGDNCSVASVTNNAPAVFPLGETTVTWIVTDASGNTATATQLVTVTDNINPTITAPQAVTGTINEDCTSTNVVLGTPVTADNCSVAGVTNDAPAAFPVGQTTVTWTVTDASGNSATATQLVSVTDNVNPTITAPVAATGTTNVDCTSTNVVLGIPVTADNCSVAGVTNDAPAAFPVGQTTVTWTVTDAGGNSATATQLVSVTDNQMPTITCSSPLANYPADNGLCTFKVAGTNLDPITADNCLIKSVTNNFNNGSTLKNAVFPFGTTTVTWTVEDGSGNKNTCSYEVVVIDTQNPTIVCSAPLENYPYVILSTELDPMVADNCGIASVINDYTNSSSLLNARFTLGTTIVTWTVTDASGNKATCSQPIEVLDNQPPTITCAAITVESYSVPTGACTYTIIGTSLDPAFEDDNTGATVVNDFNNSASLQNAVFPIGETIVVWTATDSSGNSATCSQTIIVKDTQNPTISCPANINVVAVNCLASGVVLGIPVTADNCTVASVTNDAPATFSLGSTIVTWIVRDASGNTSTCSQTVTVNGLPVAIDDVVTVDEDQQTGGNVMTNDQGLCDLPVLVKTFTQPAFGDLTMATDGSYTYAPDQDYFGTDLFTYQICDSNGDCSTATVRITINSVDDLPIATNDTEELQVDVALNGSVDDNDIWSGDGGNVWTLVDLPSNGTISFNPDGTYTYTPNINYTGTDNFTYKICDGDGDCSQAKVTIIIEDVLMANQILTPNGDDTNDTFIIEGIDLYPDNKVTVFNRWGNVVYMKNGYQNEWDGISNGNKIGSKALPIGTYYYIIDYAKNRHKTGYVYLDR